MGGAIGVGGTLHDFSIVLYYYLFEKVVHWIVLLPLVTRRCLKLVALFVGAHLLLVIVHSHARAILVVARLCGLAIYGVQVYFVAVLVVLEGVQRTTRAFL